MSRTFLLLCMLVGVTVRGFAQTPEPVTRDTLYIYTVDTTKTYELGEVVVGGTTARQASTSLVQRISLAQIERRDAHSAADVIREIPAANVQTNSRGETLLYLRNAGERQVALFFDGALLNVPWDNRVDLSFLPIGVVQSLVVSKGVPSVLYGANTMGGVVNMVSRSLGTEGRVTELTAQFGEPLTGRGVLSHLGKQGGFSYVGSFGYAGARGIPLPAGAELDYGQASDAIRTNTDAKLQNGFARGEYLFRNGSRLGASLIHIQGDKGVAPEGHKDPLVSSVRYWRYPNWQNTMLIVSTEVGLSADRTTLLRGAVWTTRFAQQIDQYHSDAYRNIAESQEDLDWTYGSRFVFQQGTETGTLRLALNALTSSHDQTNTEPEAGTSNFQEYRQHMFSMGLEYDWRLSDRVQLLAGTNLDGIAAPETGNQPSMDPLLALGAMGGVDWVLAEGWALKAFTGRKTRFPTMREWFDTALGRFVINPDLKPEGSFQLEAGLVRRSAKFSGEVVGFANLTSNAIDQEVVEVDGLLRRQRVNLEGSRIFGAELIGAGRPVEPLLLEAHLTLMHSRGYEVETDSYTRRLSEKPALISSVAATYRIPQSYSLHVETDLVGGAYGLTEDNTFTKLSNAPLFNVRLSRLFTIQREAGVYVEMFLRVDNVTNAVTTPQLGLPGPGRSVDVGLKLSM